MSNLAYTPPTDDTLRGQAASEVNTSLQGQIDPLNRESESLVNRENAAIGQIGGMFDQLQPVVKGEADAVQSSYDAANSASQGIFQAAQQRMDQLRQARAKEAQDLAQQMGGPVAVSEFTAAVDPSQTALASIAPNQLLHGLANAQAGVQQARAFSENVFPAMRTEQIANARNNFESQVADIRKQIDQINSQRGALVNQRFSELQKQERDYALQVENAKLNKLKLDRDWEATKHQLHNDDVRLGITKASVTGRLGGKKTLAAQQLDLSKRRLTVDEKNAAARLGLSKAQFLEAQRHHLVTEANAEKRLGVQRTKSAMAILDAVTGRTKGPITIQRRRELSAVQGALNLKNPKLQIVKGKDGKTHYYITENVKVSPERQYGSGFANDPQMLYDLLIGSGYAAPLALKVVKSKTGVGDFTPGKTVKYSAADLKNIGNKSFNELRGIAIQRGWKPPVKGNATTQTIINYILANQQ